MHFRAQLRLFPDLFFFYPAYSTRCILTRALPRRAKIDEEQKEKEKRARRVRRAQNRKALAASFPGGDANIRDIVASIKETGEGGRKEGGGGRSKIDRRYSRMVLRLQEVELILDPVAVFADRDLDRLAGLRRDLQRSRERETRRLVNLISIRYIDRVPETRRPARRSIRARGGPALEIHSRPE